MNIEIKKKLNALAEGNAEYAEFNKKILKTEKTVLGVRTPDMRKLAKQLAKGMDAAALMEFLRGIDGGVYEQVSLAGMLINRVELTDKKRMQFAREYLKHVDSWGLIDGFAEKMKNFDRALWWDFSIQCMNAKEEFTVRYGIMIMLANYLNDEYINAVLEAMPGATHEGYYVKMGKAWLYAEAAVNYYDKVMKSLASGATDEWTHRKALTKMIESFRFTDKQKKEIRALRSAGGSFSAPALTKEE